MNIILLQYSKCIKHFKINRTRFGPGLYIGSVEFMDPDLAPENLDP